MRRSTFVVLLLALVCCVFPEALQAQAKKQRGDRARITRDDLAEAPSSVNTAFDAIRTMRAHWLTPMMGRTASSNASSAGGGATEVVVYIDDIRQPSTEDLKTVKAATIVEMKFLDQNRAIQMRGPGHELGVIEVTTINKRK
ncbi:MAG: hypothetical protein IPP90_09160 [Gemmatimonadaceae bacterium]|nr:hypothetical protein [Gemmatimonadaceae bacterium]